ncbi:hypothetical protein [Photobacterium sp. TY1-4]|uniref:hypothetical protein n=1 Tax=Photobacterium sp. TY1-4 TaxID=2899122 RepID=UPI0021C18F1A|nr:hypothetical protein [Photobacterium sp. TY1-4]UXI04663.1 hypothetical protein NH461_25445 [Photobacterium sp. TY1-4]
MNDHDYVNFLEDHELNYHLKKVEKSQSQSNREILVGMGQELKYVLNLKRVQHGPFHRYVAEHTNRLT